MTATENLHVLVVDDSEFFASMTANTLSADHEMETYWATGADDALGILEDAEIDCIVSDYEMPGTNGLELKEMVEKRHSDIPFIILTGRGDETVAASAISAGVADYILKLEVVEDQQYQRLANRIESAVSRRRAQQRYELLVDNTPDAVAQVSAGGRILAANPAMAELTGSSQADLIDADITQVLPNNIGETLLSFGCNTVSDGDIRREEIEIGDRFYQNIFVPVDIRTERNTFQLIARDVTERAKRERELQRQNKRLDQFASMVSHDLRNPLDIAKVNITLLEDRLEDELEELPDEVEKIKDSHDRIARLIDDVLTLARHGSTIEQADPTAIDTAAKDIWTYIDAPNTDLETDTDGPILADAGRLRESLTNLFQNAVKHGDASTIRVETLEDGFIVADDGDGIPADDRENVFETGYSTADDGTGFGLAIVREIANAHGWDVTVSTSDDGGARFEFSNVEFL